MNVAVWGSFLPCYASFLHHLGGSTCLSLCPVLAPLYLVALPASPHHRVRRSHTKCRHVVLAGKQRPAPIWRPRHLWLSGRPRSSQPGQSWRSRDSLGSCILWRLRWQLWNQLSRRLLGPRRQWRVIQLWDQPSGNVSTPALVPPPLSFQAHTLPCLRSSDPTLSLTLPAGSCGPTWLWLSEGQRQPKYRGKRNSLGKKRVSGCM